MNWWALALLWLAGANLRIAMLAIPPLIPLIHDDLHLSEKLVGALNGLPVLTLAGGAIFGSLLLSRIGVIRALIVGLLLIAAAGALRGVGPSVPMLFAMTLAMGLGVAIMQPAMPTLVGHWSADRIAMATALYVNGLLVGEILAASLTIPVVLPLTGNSWTWSLAFWSIPAAVNAVLIVLALRAGVVTRPGLRGGKAAPLWWPDWRNGEMLRCSVILGCAGSLYFASNAFIPDYLHAIGRPELVGPALTALNVGQLPGSLLMLMVPHWFTGKTWPLVALGLLGAASAGAIILAGTSTPLLILFPAVLGFSCAFILILVLALPPILAEHEDIHRFSAGMFAIGYTISFATPLVSGALWDAFHIPALAFLPIGAAGVVLAALASTLHFSRARQ